MKRTLDFGESILSIISLTVGIGVTAYFSDKLDIHDVVQAGFFMLSSFVTVFFIFGEKVKGDK